MKLMIVDDHAGARQMIRELMAAPGVIFCECASGEEAIRLVPEFKPDCITMDIHMPGLNGLKTAAKIKSEHPSARIIIVTNHSHIESYFRELSQAAGAVAYVHKETLIELRQVIKQMTADENPSITPTGDSSIEKEIL